MQTTLTPSKDTDLTLRAGRPEDAAILGTICYEAFRTVNERHGYPPDFPAPEITQGLMGMMFSLPDVYSVVAEQDGRIVGSNFLWEGDTIAGIGPITVRPDAQGGVGRRLMESVLDRTREQNKVGVRLVQAGFNMTSLSLYTKLGFDIREPLACINGPALGLTIPGHEVRTAGLDDLEAANALCRRIHGHDRSVELRMNIGRGVATVVEQGGRIVGYASELSFMAHAVAETTDGLKALIAAAPNFGGPGILVPTRNSELLRWCLAHGLRITEPMNLMSLGLYNEPQGAFLPSILY